MLCATKNHEVVEYALSRAMSPALVAHYQKRLPDKKLLQAKLHEFYALAESRLGIEETPEPQKPKNKSATGKKKPKGRKQ